MLSIVSPDFTTYLSIEALLKLPGVGRKSANLIMGDVFGKPAIVTIFLLQSLYDLQCPLLFRHL